MPDELKKQILLVEDEIIIAMDEKTTLERYGFKVIVANNGEDAIVKVENNPTINLILMDINLGKGIDGTETATKILEKYDIPIVFLSSHIEKEVVEKTEGITSYGYIVKNSGETVLIASIKMAFKLFEAKMKEKEKEDALRYERDKAQWYINTVETIIVAVNIEGEIITINRKGTQILEYSENELIGKSWFKVCLPQPEGMEVVYPVFKKLIRGETKGVEYFENNIITRSGEKRLIAWHNSVLYDDKGNIIGTLGSGQDITEQKKVQEALNTQNEFIASFFENLPIGIALFENNGVLLQINQKFTEITGYTIEEITPEEKWFEKAYPDRIYRYTVMEDWKQSLKLKNADKAFKVTCKDGTVKIIDFKGVFLSDGKAIITMLDITEKKKTEEELLKFKTISDEANYGSAIFDLRGNILYVNETLASMHECSIDELIGKHFSIFHNYEQMFELNKILEILMKKGRFSTQKIWHITKSGTIFPTLMHAVVIKDKKGAPQYISATTIDITELEEVKSGLKKEEALYEALLKITKNILEINNFNDVARKIFNVCCEVTGAKSGYVALLNKNGDENEVLFLESGGLDCTVDPSLPMPIRGLRSEAYKKQKVVYRNDFYSSEWIKYMPSGHVQLNNVLFAPLTVDGKTIGLIGIANKPSPFTEEDAQVMGLFGDLTAIALRNTRMLESILNEKKKVEKMLDEKEFLIREVHHRIKNNISLISGLLSLKSISTSNLEAKTILQDIKNRIYNVNILYEKMFIRKEYHNIPMKEYLDDLIDTISSLFPKDLKKITIEKQIDNFDIDTKLILPIAFLVNELLTNIMKYAFEGKENGLVNISLRKDNSHINLIIKDDGIGLPENFDINKTNSFGFMLVQAMNEQLGGSFNIENDNGTKFSMEFDIPEYG